jgi:hypothetical protein
LGGECLVDGLLFGAQRDGLHDGAGRSGEGDLADSPELPVDVSPRLAAAAFGDAGQGPVCGFEPLR